MHTTAYDDVIMKSSIQLKTLVATWYVPMSVASADVDCAASISLIWGLTAVHDSEHNNNYSIT